MQKIVLLTLAAMAFPGVAIAKDFKLPSDSPIITFTLPDSWSPKEVDTGYEATSDDGSTYVSLEVLEAKNAKDVDSIINDVAKFLKEQGVTIDPGATKQENTEVNGMKGLKLSANGKDKDGDTIVNLFILDPGKDKVVSFTYWGTPEGQAKNVGVVNEALHSIKPAS